MNGPQIFVISQNSELFDRLKASLPLCRFGLVSNAEEIPLPSIYRDKRDRSDSIRDRDRDRDREEIDLTQNGGMHSYSPSGKRQMSFYRDSSSVTVDGLYSEEYSSVFSFSHTHVSIIQSIILDRPRKTIDNNEKEGKHSMTLI